MKRKLISSLFVAASLLLTTSCGTTPRMQTVQAEAGIITSVNIAMDVWGDRVRAGKATQEQVDIVKALYNTYYNSQLAVKEALKKSIANNSPAGDLELQIALKRSEEDKTALLNKVNELNK